MRFLAVLFLVPAAAFAQIGSDVMPDRSPKVTIEGAITKQTGDVVEGVIDARVAAGWHINSHTPTESFSIPTVLMLDNAELTNVTYPKHEMRAFQFTEGKPIAVYTDAFQIPFTAKLKAARRRFTRSCVTRPAAIAFVCRRTRRKRIYDSLVGRRSPVTGGARMPQ